MKRIYQDHSAPLPGRQRQPSLAEMADQARLLWEAREEGKSKMVEFMERARERMATDPVFRARVTWATDGAEMWAGIQHSDSDLAHSAIRLAAAVALLLAEQPLP